MATNNIYRKPWEQGNVMNTVQKENKILQQLLEDDSNTQVVEPIPGSLQSDQGPIGFDSESEDSDTEMYQQTSDKDIFAAPAPAAGKHKQNTSTSTLFPTTTGRPTIGRPQATSVATTEYTIDSEGAPKKQKKRKKRRKDLSFRKEDLPDSFQAELKAAQFPAKAQRLNTLPAPPNPELALANDSTASSGLGKALVKSSDGTKARGTADLDVEDYTPCMNRRGKSLTLRMKSEKPHAQIRIKCYLPHEPDDDEPEIIVLHIDKGTSMGFIVVFLEDSYPYTSLRGRIRQLCIADDDGDIDEDFPPIQKEQDVTSMGVGNFYIDIQFDNDAKPSFSREESLPMRMDGARESHRSVSQLSQQMALHQTIDEPLGTGEAGAAQTHRGTQPISTHVSKMDSLDNTPTLHSDSVYSSHRSTQPTTMHTMDIQHNTNTPYDSDNDAGNGFCSCLPCFGGNKKRKPASQPKYSNPVYNDGNVVAPLMAVNTGTGIENIEIKPYPQTALAAYAQPTTADHSHSPNPAMRQYAPRQKEKQTQKKDFMKNLPPPPPRELPPLNAEVHTTTHSTLKLHKKADVKRAKLKNEFEVGMDLDSNRSTTSMVSQRQYTKV